MDEMVQRALVLAMKAHENQKRKDGVTPYVVHPIMVALNCAKHGLDDSAITAAILHDVVEDTNVTLDELRKHFPQDVCNMVNSLTKYPDMKKTKYLGSLVHNIYPVRCIKTADRIHNLSESRNMGPAWRKKYLSSTDEYVLPMAVDTPFYDELLEEREKVLLFEEVEREDGTGKVKP
jgi:GTP pyrophosphokinase